jgi:nitrite reductase (cytochrome c-552)
MIRTLLALTILLAAAAAAGLAALLVNIHQRQTEARDPYLKLVRVGEETTDPAPWGTNFPRQYDGYRRTVDATHTRYGGSDGAPAASRLEKDPWLRRLFAGYAFALDFRERRGHAYMLTDQEKTLRVRERPQPGACLHCHASVIPTYRRLGDGDVAAGFVALGKLPYAEAHAEVVETGSRNPVAEGNTQGFAHAPGAHPVSCVDCHEPETMRLRVTRPGFRAGIAELAAGDAAVPSLTTPTGTPRARRCAPSSAASATSSTTADPRRRSSTRGRTGSPSRRSRPSTRTSASPTARPSTTGNTPRRARTC